MFLSLPIRLLGALLGAYLCHPLLPLPWQAGFYAISATLREILMAVIPLVIFSSVYEAFRAIRAEAWPITRSLIPLVIGSNVVSVLLGGAVTFLVHRPDHMPDAMVSDPNALLPLWTFHWPAFLKIPNLWALCAALVLALLPLGRLRLPCDRLADLAHQISAKFLKHLFIPILPLFLFGFFIKIFADHLLELLLRFNIASCIAMLLTVSLYLLILLVGAARLYQIRPWALLQILMPGILVAFSTTSSAAALPMAIENTTAITKNRPLVGTVMPIIMNIHMIGDSICIPILAMSLLLAFGHPLPDLPTYLSFAILFALTKFSGAGVPGGTILIMIPVLEHHLHFDAAMSGVITSLYLLIDPLTSSSNACGNTLFMLYFQKLFARIQKARPGTRS